MSEWTVEIIGNYIDVQNGYAFKSSDFKNSNGIPVIKIKNVASGKLDLSDTQYYVGSIEDKQNFIINKGDILIAMTGSHVHQPSSMVGRVVRYDLERTALLNQRVGKIYSLDKNILDEDFIYQFYRQNDVTYELALNAGGSANQANISPTLIKSLSFSKPPLPEQKAIAGVLSCLDDKIDLLHRQNKTLEAMAETLFRQWFIEEADEGWADRPLSSIANFLNGLACQKFPPKNEQERLPVLKIKELSCGISESSDWASTDISPGYIVQNGDVIFAWSASLMVTVWDGEKCILNQHLFKVSSDQFPKWFYLEWCKYHLAEFISISLSHATTMGHIKRGDLDTAMVMIPSEKELFAMSKQMNPLLDKKIANTKQIRTLENLRDTLLPKLMSGEVRVAI